MLRKTHQCPGQPWKSGPSGPRKSYEIECGFQPLWLSFALELSLRNLFSRAAKSVKLDRFASEVSVGRLASDFLNQSRPHNSIGGGRAARSVAPASAGMRHRLQCRPFFPGTWEPCRRDPALQRGCSPYCNREISLILEQEVTRRLE